MQAAGQALCKRGDFGRGSRIFLQRAGDLPSCSGESGLEYLRKFPALSRTQTGITNARSLVVPTRDSILQTAAVAGRLARVFRLRWGVPAASCCPGLRGWNEQVRWRN